jgi:ABC-type Fe3+ transport system permease subunit
MTRARRAGAACAGLGLVLSLLLLLAYAQLAHGQYSFTMQQYTAAPWNPRQDGAVAPLVAALPWTNGSQSSGILWPGQYVMWGGSLSSDNGTD